jgi:mono/diheme cytochrome c family protein
MIRFTAAALLAVSAFAAQPRDLKAFYQHGCAACHGQDGSGRSATGARLPGRNLADARWQSKKTDAQLVKSILEGKDAMPAYSSQLSQDEALRLVTEVLRPFAAHRK